MADYLDLENAERARVDDRRQLVTDMDPVERAARIAELREQADEHRAELGRGAAEREQDRGKMQDWLMAEGCRASIDRSDGARYGPQRDEPIGAPHTHENERPLIIHRDYLGEALASSPQPEPMPSEGEPYPAFDQLVKGVAKGVVTLLQRKLAERDERLNVLETEVVELKRRIREGKARDPKRRAGRHE